MTAQQDDNKVIIGKVGAPYGVKGWVKLHSFAEPKDNILLYTSFFIKNNKNLWQPVEILEIKKHGSGFVAQFKDVANRDDAKLITNLEIGVLRSELPDLAEDEFYWEDLVGLGVFNAQNEALGKITEVFNAGANDILVVKQGKQEHLIPYVDNHVIDVDLDNNKITVYWEFTDSE